LYSGTRKTKPSNLSMFAPGAGVVVLVLLEVRVARLVEVAEVVVGEVDEFVVGAAMGTGGLQRPGGDLVAAASRAGASKDECDAECHLPSELLRQL
jgi:hypothetical protein